MKGDKVGSSEAALLSKLGIRPFSYGLVVLSVYDNGSVFSPEVLDLTEDDLMEKFAAGVSVVTSLALALSYPTLAAAPHMFANAYKNVLALAVATDYSFPQADEVKEYLKVMFSFPPGVYLYALVFIFCYLFKFDILLLLFLYLINVLLLITGSQQVCSCCCPGCC